MIETKHSLLLLVAASYRSGIQRQPLLIEKNVKTMTDTALEIYRVECLPVLGEWFALPLPEQGKNE